MSSRQPRAERAKYEAEYYALNRQAEIDRVAAWRKANPAKARAQYRRGKQNKKVKQALEAAAQAKAAAKPAPSPKLSALLKLAEVKAAQAQYGITRIGYQETR